MNLRQKINFASNAIVVVSVVLVLFWSDTFHSKAQQSYWSEQKKIPEYEIVNNEQPPYLVADQNHVVHAFNSQSLVLDESNSPKAIFYRQWTLENGWTYPNDILYDNIGGGIELVGVSSDQSGRVQLIYQNYSGDIYYTNAYLANASNPNTWSEPTFIGGQSLHIRQGIPNIGAIASDETSNEIVIVYSGGQYGNGLYFTLSSDQGSSWTDPYPIYLTGSQSLIVSDPKLYMGKSGILHAVWATTKDNGFGDSAYYSGFDLIKKVWSDPVQLDIPGIQTPSIIESKSDVFIGYYRQDDNKNWWRRIIDNSGSWTLPTHISENHVGRNGAVSFAVDSNDDLHVFFAQRIDDNNHGMWHSVWMGTQWTSPEAVVKAPRNVDVVGGNGFDPNSARAIISNGNVILVTWGTDGGAGQNGAWYSYKTLDIAELPSLPLSSPIALPNNIATIENPVATSVVVEKTPVALVDKSSKYPDFLRSPQFPLLFGIIPVILLLVGIVIVKFLFRSKN